MQPDQQLPLKDIHLPDVVSWWPPAIGYWLLLLLIIFIIAGIFFIRHLRKMNRIKKLALNEFNSIKQRYENDLDANKLVNSLSALLRRAAISCYPRTDCASLTGSNWLTWLDKQFKDNYLQKENGFSTGPGYLLTEFNYSGSSHSNDITQLIKLTESWLKQLPAVKDNRVN